MPKNISRRELIQKFKKLGFEGPFSRGRHQFMSKGSLKVRIPNPYQGEISKSLSAELLRQAGILGDKWSNI